MADLRITLGAAACFAVLAASCATSGGKVEEVREVGPGLYSLEFSSLRWLSDAKQPDKALEAAVEKAGAYCHSKDQKLEIVRSEGSRIDFRCVSN